MTLYDKYQKRKYEDGGETDPEKDKLNQALGLGTKALAGAGAIADAIDAPNAYGQQSTGTNILKNVGSYASMGASFGPIGAGVGAGLGVLTGLVTSAQQKREERFKRSAETNQARQASLSQYAARAASDSTLAQGVTGGGYFANGGNLQGYVTKAKGGYLKPLNSNTVEVIGNSHAQGGVDLPSGEEVEGQETITGNYVMSDKLGFAPVHKKLAKAIGVLEKKAPSQSVTNSLGRLREKEQALIFFQEMYRKQHNLK